MKRFFLIVICQFLIFSVHALEKSVFFTFGPNIMLNTDDKAPSPNMYSLGIGGDLYLENSILIQPHISFFTNYYLWDGERAQPAEVENRTATALSAMIDLCAGHTWIKGENQNNFISLTGGLALFVRYGILSNGVKADDKNRDTNSTASEDISNINKDFYSDLNFLYPEIAFSYSHTISEIWKVGVENRAYLPLGSLIKGKGLDGMIFSLALKFSYK